jgi:hypothetical protein
MHALFGGLYEHLSRPNYKKTALKNSALISASIQFDQLNLSTGNKNFATLASSSPELVALKSV